MPKLYTLLFFLISICSCKASVEFDPSGSYARFGSFEDLAAHIDLRPGDVVFKDIDGVVLDETKGVISKRLQSLHVLRFAHIIQQKGAHRFFLTARSPQQKSSTVMILKSLGFILDNYSGLYLNNDRALYHRGVLFSPDQNGSTKIANMTDFLGVLKKAGHQIKRAFFIDNENRHFQGVIQGMHLNSVPTSFYHYVYQPELVYSSVSGLSGTFDKMPSYLSCLKAWGNQDLTVEACASMLLYRDMGGNVPDFGLFYDIPEQHKTLVKSQGQPAFYGLLQDMKGQPLRNNITLPIPANLALRLLGHDVVELQQFVEVNQSYYWHDSRGGFYHHANGQKRKRDRVWTPYQINLQGIQFNEDALIAGEMILSKRKQMHDTLKALGDSLFYAKTPDLLNFLHYRLDHLQFMVDFYRGRINVLADPYVKSTDIDAAGTLIYWVDAQGDAQILLGKRSDGGKWCNLGGAADLEEDLAQAASRETREESGGVIDIPPGLLLDCPFHDTVTFEKGLLKRYRTVLFRLKDYVDPSKLKDHEYTEYKWVRAESLLLNPDQLELYEPFKVSLAQSRINGWLEQLSNGEMINDHSATQSLVGHPNLMPIQRPLESDHTHKSQALAVSIPGRNMPPAPSLMEAGRDFITRTINSVSKLHLRPSSNPKIEQESNSASINVMKKLSNRSFASAREMLVSILEKINNYSAYSQLSLTNEQIDTVIDIINLEKQFPSMYPLYHGTMGEIWLCYRALSWIRHQHNASPVETTVMRSTDLNLYQLGNSLELAECVLEGQSDGDPRYRAGGVSTNASLVGNIFNAGSSTLHYGFKGKSADPPKEVWAIATCAFKEMGLPAVYLTSELQRIFKQTCKLDSTGAILQIFIDHSLARDLCYLSKGGRDVQMDSAGKRLADPTEMLEAIRLGNAYDRQPGIAEMEVRILANLSAYPGRVRVFDHFTDGKDQQRLQDTDDALRRLFEPHLYYLAKSILYNCDLYSCSVPKLIGDFRKEWSIRDHELHVSSPLVRAAQRGDIDLVWYIHEHPGVLDDESELNREYTESKNMNSQSIGTLPLVKQLKAAPWAIKLLCEFYPQGGPISKLVVFVEGMQEMGEQNVRAGLELMRTYDLFVFGMDGLGAYSLFMLVNKPKNLVFLKIMAEFNLMSLVHKYNNISPSSARTYIQYLISSIEKWSKITIENAQKVLTALDLEYYMKKGVSIEDLTSFIYCTDIGYSSYKDIDEILSGAKLMRAGTEAGVFRPSDFYGNYGRGDFAELVRAYAHVKNIQAVFETAKRLDLPKIVDGNNKIHLLSILFVLEEDGEEILRELMNLHREIQDSVKQMMLYKLCAQVIKRIGPQHAMDYFKKYGNTFFNAIYNYIKASCDFFISDFGSKHDADQIRKQLDNEIAKLRPEVSSIKPSSVETQISTTTVSRPIQHSQVTPSYGAQEAVSKLRKGDVMAKPVLKTPAEWQTLFSNAGLLKKKQDVSHVDELYEVIHSFGEDNARPILELLAKHAPTPNDWGYRSNELEPILTDLQTMGDRADALLSLASVFLKDESNAVQKRAKIKTLSMLGEKGMFLIRLMSEGNSSPHNYLHLIKALDEYKHDCLTKAETDPRAFKKALYSDTYINLKKL